MGLVFFFFFLVGGGVCGFIFFFFCKENHLSLFTVYKTCNYESPIAKFCFFFIYSITSL